MSPRTLPKSAVNAPEVLVEASAADSGLHCALTGEAADFEVTIGDVEIALSYTGMIVVSHTLLEAYRSARAQNFSIRNEERTAKQQAAQAKRAANVDAALAKIAEREAKLLALKASFVNGS